MNDDALRRLLRNSLLGRRAPAGLWERVSARLSGGARRPLALTFAALAAIVMAAGLKVALRAPAAPAPVPEFAAPAFPAWVAGAVEQHEGLSDLFAKAPPMAPRELSERVREQSGVYVDLPGLREAGYEPREVHRCLAKGVAHVVYANTWSKLSCFIFQEKDAPLGDGGRGIAGGARLFANDELSVVAMKEDSLVKVWISELRPGQLARIARDAEHKRDRIKSADLAVLPGPAARAVESLLLGLPGVEDVRVETGTARVEFDDSQTSEAAIRALAAMNGVSEWGSDGR